MWWLAKVETHWNLILVWLLHVVSNTIIYDHIRSTKISFRPGSPSAQAKQASAAAPGQRPWAKLSLLSPGTCSVFVAPSLSTVLDSRGESLVHVFKNDAGHRGFGPTKMFWITMGVDLIRSYGAQACALRLAALTLAPGQNSHRWEAQQTERAIGRPSAVELHDEEPPVLSVSVAVFQHTIGLLNCRDQAKIHQTWNNKRLKFIQTNGDDRRCLSHLFDSSRIKHINVADQTALLVLCGEPRISEPIWQMAVLQSLPDKTVWANQSQGPGPCHLQIKL